MFSMTPMVFNLNKLCHENERKLRGVYAHGLIMGAVVALLLPKQASLKTVIGLSLRV